MLLSFNSKPNISFTGLQEDIKFSQKIVSEFRKEVGRPNSDSYIYIRMLQHQGDPKYAEILQKLKVSLYKYNAQIYRFRDYFDRLSFKDFSEYAKRLKKLITREKIGNCGEMNDIVQYEHLNKGVDTHKIHLSIFDKDTCMEIKDHCFLLRGLPKEADLTDPKTWGEAILVDSWTGSGIVDQAILPKGLVKKGALDEVLKYLMFNPEKEETKFMSNNSEHAENFINNMRK